jgi:hypothetical protein
MTTGVEQAGTDVTTVRDVTYELLRVHLDGRRTGHPSPSSWLTMGPEVGVRGRRSPGSERAVPGRPGPNR